MGELREHRPVLLILAAFGGDAQALDWTRDTAVRAWGPVALTSELFEFAETRYYDQTMGSSLKKVFLAFEQLIDPAAIVEIKRQTNEWEQAYAMLGRRVGPQQVIRPLNLDPGYLTEAKLVLASTKDHAHRIYLGGGVYAEVTLHYRDGDWRKQPWTYPDYRRDEYRRFFHRCRDYLRERLGRGATL